MHRSKAATKFRATCLRRAAPERQPKSGRGENPGNARAGAARNSCTEARPRRSFGQRVYAEPRRSDNRNQVAVKIRARPGQVPREILHLTMSSLYVAAFILSELFSSKFSATFHLLIDARRKASVLGLFGWSNSCPAGPSSSILP